MYHLFKMGCFKSKTESPINSVDNELRLRSIEQRKSVYES